MDPNTVSNLIQSVTLLIIAVSILFNARSIRALQRRMDALEDKDRNVWP